MIRLLLFGSTIKFIKGNVLSNTKHHHHLHFFSNQRGKSLHKKSNLDRTGRGLSKSEINLGNNLEGEGLGKRTIFAKIVKIVVNHHFQKSFWENILFVSEWILNFYLISYTGSQQKWDQFCRWNSSCNLIINNLLWFFWGLRVLSGGSGSGRLSELRFLTRHFLYN